VTERRVKVMRVDPQILVTLCKAGPAQLVEVRAHGVPHDAQARDAFYNHETGMLDIMVQSASYEDMPAGLYVERLQPTVFCSTHMPGESLAADLLALLLPHAGEGETPMMEGAVECLRRLLAELVDARKAKQAAPSAVQPAQPSDAREALQVLYDALAYSHQPFHWDTTIRAAIEQAEDALGVRRAAPRT
jgi:hypothetical protein